MKISVHWPQFLPAIVFCLGLLAGVSRPTVAADSSSRRVLSLNGKWQFQREAAVSNGWKEVEVPSTFQSHEGTDFHGTGWYRRMLPPIDLPQGKRVLLCFSAAATEATVFLDSTELGRHLGGWTPFRFDITEILRRSKGEPLDLRVRLDEKVGHNTQGFLPVIEPHFGGLWQAVELLIVPGAYVDDLRFMAIGDPKTGEIHGTAPIAGNSSSDSKASLRFRLRGTEEWIRAMPPIINTNTLSFKAKVTEARLWSPTQPNLYELEIVLPGAEGDRLEARVAFRSVEAVGREFRLNGAPLSVRGILNWGYSPPVLAPNPGEKAWTEELDFLKSHGFNLMKFCLWVPPKRYLDLADERGVLTWMEYPTWHPNLTAKFINELRTEFREFFEYDRNHPCVILRSLTCETGPSVEISVIRSLYDLAHQCIPGALVEDDSSWISWNRVSDFYDDHPYGNNHSWVATLDGLNRYIETNGVKPLVLGEAMAADTWMDRPAILNRLGRKRPWWSPAPLDNIQLWLEAMRQLNGPEGLEELRSDSLRYGLLMRKYQIEAYRREIPSGGYVVSVIRDFPKASMGLIDYLGRPKWNEQEWDWHGETMLLLKTEGDVRSFGSGTRFESQLLLSHFGSKPLTPSRLKLTLEYYDQTSTATEIWHQEQQLHVGTSQLQRVAGMSCTLPEVQMPVHLRVRATIDSPSGLLRNEWPIWVMPGVSRDVASDVQVHESVRVALRKELFEKCPSFGPRVQSSESGIVVASRFDTALVDHLERGGKVLFLPDGNPGSLPLDAHWFLRGAPYVPHNALSSQIPRNLLVELQHFDLASDVVPDVPWLENLDPILLLWDTHDLDRIRTHGILFETKVGEGRLLVNTARLTGSNNVAGRWLLKVLLDHLRSSGPPRHGLPMEVRNYLKAKLVADRISLVSRSWKFQADPGGKGLTNGWQMPDFKEVEEWRNMRIGEGWKSQGFPGLDGWGWYRLWVDVPEKWRDQKIYLSFEGVDATYELYVNGKSAGKGGDLATRTDASSERKSYDISDFVEPGGRALLVIRVYHSKETGGIVRPVTLGTLPFSSLDFLK